MHPFSLLAVSLLFVEVHGTLASLFALQCSFVQLYMSGALDTLQAGHPQQPQLSLLLPSSA